MKHFLFFIVLIILGILLFYNWDYAKLVLERAKDTVESCEVKDGVQEHYKKGKAWIIEKLSEDES